MTERKRFHIRSLQPDTLSSILTGDLQKQAQNISFHTIETFPESNYGFVDLPVKSANALRSKLNGCYVKGRKVHIEEARAEVHMARDVTEDHQPKAGKKQRRNKVKEDGVIPAIILPADRSIKRGWTDEDDPSASKQRRQKKKSEGKPKEKSITGGKECLFKTKVPPNKADIQNGTGKKRKRGSNGDEITVHEFEKTTKHASFLRSSTKKNAGKIAATDDAQVGEAKGERGIAAGAVVKPHDKSKTTNLLKDEAETTAQVSDETSSEGTDDEETSSSGTSDSDDGATPKADNLGLDREAKSRPTIERLSISRSSGSPAPHIDTEPLSAPSPDRHPLEVLFKRPKQAASSSQQSQDHTPRKPNLEVTTSFSFFDDTTNDTTIADPDTDALDRGMNNIKTLQVPQTPFTQQDFRHRRQRSAAPTPDTAAPGRTFGDVFARADSPSDTHLEDQDEDGVGVVNDITHLADLSDLPDGGQDGESAFAKKFWEIRGESNRAWKRQRREALKAQKTLAAAAVGTEGKKRGGSSRKS